MPPILALILCSGFVAVLLWIEHKQNPEAPLALWIPTIWMFICGSRPVGRWVGFDMAYGTIEEGSPLDRLVLIILICLALVVIYLRKFKWPLVLKKNLGLFLLYLFVGVSILWSDFPYLSMKRWIRLLGVIPIAMVILSEKAPFEALESIFRRCAYVLLSFSLVLIKYYPQLGVSYGRWSGRAMWDGVTSGKNTLGQLCAFSAFFFIWTFLRDLRKKNLENTVLNKVADGLVFAIAIILLKGTGGAYSATSIAALVVVTISLLILYGMKNSAKGISTLLFGLTIVLWLSLSFSETFSEMVSTDLGRDQTFTGRTDMWRMLIETASRHPLLGAGFGGYFGTPGNEFAAVNEGYTTGHNGLLDVYVELGLVGILLVVVFHMAFYIRFRRELNREFYWGVFGLCFLIMEVLCNFTESLILGSSIYIWNITIFLMIVFSEKYLDNKN